MITLLKRSSWMILSCILSGTANAGSGGGPVPGAVDPGFVKVKVYEIRVSPNTDCTNGIVVARYASPTLFDMVNNPTLGSGTISNGTYRCVMLRMTNYIHFTPSATDPSWTHSVCIPGSDYETNVARNITAVDPDGTIHTLGAGDPETPIWLYIRSNAPTTNDTNSFSPVGGIPLTSPLVVNGDGAHTMVFDFSHRVGEGQDNGVWSCGCEAPTLGFR
jgi:hypothetical protein